MYRTTRVFPAPAGMNRKHKRRLAIDLSVPRARGDEPAAAEVWIRRPTATEPVKLRWWTPG